MRPTKMRVSVNTLVENAKALRADVPEQVKLLWVVKADGYGHGAIAVAQRLEQNGLADGFAVAICEEARALRVCGVKSMIVILGGADESSLREAVWLGASQAIYRPEDLVILEDEARRLGVRAKAHLKVDSGMSRIGVRNERELNRLLEKWRDCPHVEMEGCFTHFCAADEQPDYTEQQDAVFLQALARVRAEGCSPVAHAAATGAMMDERYQYDMVRVGIGLYGGGLPGMKGRIHYAQTLVTRPIRIERISEGDTVGYGRTFMAQRDTVIMTLPVGYGDGYPRALSNRAEVLVRGRRAKVVGRVCMDMMMVDITDIPEATLGDEVVLMGRQGDERITPDELAAHADTIPYEIMLGFSPRIPREYAD